MKIFNNTTMLVIGGVTATIAGFIMMKKASIKADKITEEHRENKKVIEQCAEEYSDSDEYTEEDRINDHRINDVKTAVSLFKAYLLPYLTFISGGCLLIRGSYLLFNQYNRVKGVHINE